MIKNKIIDWELWPVCVQRSHPHFRLAGWIKLLGRNTISEIIDKIMNIFVERLPYPVVYKKIIEIFYVPVTGYWKSHSRLAKPSVHAYKVFFSKNRINECIINVIVPLLAAQAIRSGSAGFKQYIEDFSANIPCNSNYLGFSGYFPWYRKLKKRIPGHILHQGLCQLYNSYCSGQRCDACPLIIKQPISRSL